MLPWDEDVMRRAERLRRPTVGSMRGKYVLGLEKKSTN